MERESMLVQSIYYGKIGSHATERLLERYGNEGSFLLRDSETVQGAYCLCVRKTPFVRTYRLLHSSDGWSLQLASRESFRCFETLDRLLESYRTGITSDVNIAPLTHPLDKSQLGDSSLGHESVYMEM
ncbi:SH2 domain-containing protein 1A-like [Polymixia lowei]